MIYLFLNFFLALAWMMLNGSYSSLNLLSDLRSVFLL